MNILDEDRSTVVLGLTRVRFALSDEYCDRFKCPELKGRVKYGVFYAWPSSSGAKAVQVWFDGEDSIDWVGGDAVEVLR